MSINREPDKQENTIKQLKWNELSLNVSHLRVQNCQMFSNGKIPFQIVKYMHIFMYVG